MPDKIRTSREAIKICSRHILFPSLHHSDEVELIIPNGIRNISVFSQVRETSAIPEYAFHEETLLFRLWCFLRTLSFLDDDLVLRPDTFRSQILMSRSRSSKSTSVISLTKWERRSLSVSWSSPSLRSKGLGSVLARASPFSLGQKENISTSIRLRALYDTLISLALFSRYIPIEFNFVIRVSWEDLPAEKCVGVGGAEPLC